MIFAYLDSLGLLVKFMKYTDITIDDLTAADGAFVWSNTPEGREYWSDIFNKIDQNQTSRDITTDDILYLETNYPELLI